MIARMFSLLVAAASITYGAMAPAQAADPLKGYPLVIICGDDQVARIGCLSEVKADGSATYLSANGRLAAEVTADGVVRPPSTNKLKGACMNRTIDELRDEGRVIDGR